MIEIFFIGMISGELSSNYFTRLSVKSTLYPNFINSLKLFDNFDIGLIPLINNKFNRCKSPIKFFDLTQLGLAVIASNSPPYTFIENNGARFSIKNTEKIGTMK
jgi:hypothetical protein